MGRDYTRLSGIPSECGRVNPAVDACAFEDSVGDSNRDAGGSEIDFNLESVDHLACSSAFSCPDASRS